MFSKPAVRSRGDIIEGLLTRAFARSQEDGEKMELLIEWRLAACRHANRQALRKFNSDYKVAEHMSTHSSTGSRGLNAFNWISTIEGRNDTLMDAQLERRIKDMEHMHHWARFFKNSDIQVDLDALRKAAIRNNPNAPIMMNLSQTQPSQRSSLDMVYMKSTETPAYLKTLSEIDSKVDWGEGSGGGNKGAKKECRQTHIFETALKPILH